MTHTNNIILIGNFGYTFSTNPCFCFNHKTITCAIGSADIYMLIISPNGSFVKFFTTSSSAGYFDINRTSIVDSTIMLVGSFAGNVDFDPGLDSTILSTGATNLISPFVLVRWYIWF